MGCRKVNLWTSWANFFMMLYLVTIGDVCLPTFISLLFVPFTECTKERWSKLRYEQRWKILQWLSIVVNNRMSSAFAWLVSLHTINKIKRLVKAKRLPRLLTFCFRLKHNLLLILKAYLIVWDDWLMMKEKN